MPPPLADGISEDEGSAEASDQDAMAAIMADGVTFRSTRLTAPVGSSLPLDDAALFTMVDVYDGKVERTATGPEGGTPPFWNPIHGGVLTSSPDWTFDLVVSGDDAAVVNELAVLPAALASACRVATPETSEGGNLMRTLRLSLVGTVILMLLGGLSGAVVAQSETLAPVEAVHATGSTSASEIPLPTITTLPNGATRITVNGHWVLTMDDPRFSGTETFIHTEDHYGETVGPVFGTTRLENEGGAWLGQYRGVILPDGSATYVGTYVGVGGYEGLSAACSSHSDGAGAKGDCILYPGPVSEIEPPAG